MTLKYFIVLLCCLLNTNILSIEIDFSISYEDGNIKAEILGQPIYDEKANKDKEEKTKLFLAKTEVSKTEKALVSATLDLKKTELTKKMLELKLKNMG